MGNSQRVCCNCCHKRHRGNPPLLENMADARDLEMQEISTAGSRREQPFTQEPFTQDWTNCLDELDNNSVGKGSSEKSSGSKDIEKENVRATDKEKEKDKENDKDAIVNPTGSLRRTSQAFRSPDQSEVEEDIDSDKSGGEESHSSKTSWYSLPDDPAFRTAMIPKNPTVMRITEDENEDQGDSLSPIKEERRPSRSEKPRLSKDDMMSSVSTLTAAMLKAANRAPSLNSNRVSQYKWTEEILDLITESNARGVAVDTSSKSRCTPVFVVAGACPNRLCGMQAVLYSSRDGGHPWMGRAPDVDFWWVKPQRDVPDQLERETVNRHASGPHKNDPGRSSEFYRPLADKFVAGRDGDFIFGLDPETGRAYIKEDVEHVKERMLLYLVWQEEWSNPWARKRYLRGKICYQRALPGAPVRREFFARHYELRDGRIAIYKGEEEKIPSMMPPNSFQALPPDGWDSMLVANTASGASLESND